MPQTCSGICHAQGGTEILWRVFIWYINGPRPVCLELEKHLPLNPSLCWPVFKTTSDFVCDEKILMALLWFPNTYTPVLVTAGSIIIFLLCLALILKTRRTKQCSQPLRFSDPAVCAQIIACTGYDNSEAKNQYSDLRSRAIPNERLIRAFNIDNSFTTSEGKRHKEFKLKAGKAIKLTEDKVGTFTSTKLLIFPQASMCISRAGKSLGSFECRINAELHLILL